MVPGVAMVTVWLPLVAMAPGVGQLPDATQVAASTVDQVSVVEPLTATALGVSDMTGAMNARSACTNP